MSELIINDDDLLKLIKNGRHKERYTKNLMLYLLEENKVKFKSNNIALENIAQDIKNEELIRSMALMSEIKFITDILKSSGIRYILLKGAAYKCKYNCSRIFNDIDILILDLDWEKAKVILSEQYFIDSTNDGVLSQIYELTLRRKKNESFPIDLHRHLIHEQLFNIKSKFIFERSKYIESARQFTLDPEMMVIHQALHAFKDCDFYTDAVFDFQRIIKNDRFIIEDFLDIAKSLGINYIAYFWLNSVNYSKLSIVESELNINERKLARCTRAFEKMKTKTNKYKYRINQIRYFMAFEVPIKRIICLISKYLYLYIRKKIGS